jgi:hypothetical protein
MQTEPCDTCLTNAIYYALVDWQQGMEVRIELIRTSEEDALDSVVFLPAPHEFSLPDYGTYTSDTPFTASGDAVDFNWAPVAPEDEVVFHVRGCGDDLTRRLPLGSDGYLLPSGTLRLPQYDGAPCGLYVEVTLSRTGTVDPAYEFGRFEAAHRQVRIFYAVP